MDCTKIFKDSSAKMQCRSHHCTKCIGKTDEEYKILQNSDSMWFCIECREIIQKSIITDMKIEDRCSAIMEVYESRISSLQESITKKCDEEMVLKLINEMNTQEKPDTEQRGPTNPATTPRPNLTNIMTQINERKSIESSIVIYGMLECNSNTRDDRIAHDTEKVNSILGK